MKNTPEINAEWKKRVSKLSRAEPRRFHNLNTGEPFLLESNRAVLKWERRIFGESCKRIFLSHSQQLNNSNNNINNKITLYSFWLRDNYGICLHWCVRCRKKEIVMLIYFAVGVYCIPHFFLSLAKFPFKLPSLWSSSIFSAILCQWQTIEKFSMWFFSLSFFFLRTSIFFLLSLRTDLERQWY